MKLLLKFGVLFLTNCLFIGLTGNAQNKIISYQYWFDNDYASNSLALISPTELLELNTSISLETVDDGLHSFTIRFKDETGLWSIPSSQFFYYVDIINNNIIGYQYWFDNDFSTNTIVASTPTEQVQISEAISIENIKEGLHLFSIRFKDKKGNWSIPVSQYFYKTPRIANNKITAYRYWINEDIANAKYISISNPSQLLNLNDDIDFSGLTIGEYTIHFQFKDSSEKWSLATSDNFTLNFVSAIENTFVKTIAAYPNPTTGVIHLELDAIFNTIEIKIFDNTGRIIQQESHKNEQSFKLSLNNNSVGFYYIMILADDKKATFQFIKN